MDTNHSVLPTEDKFWQGKGKGKGEVMSGQGVDMRGIFCIIGTQTNNN